MSPVLAGHKPKGLSQLTLVPRLRVHTCQPTPSSDDFQHKACAKPQKQPREKTTQPPQPALIQMLTSSPVAASQIFTRLSPDPLMTRFPSGENATDKTVCECPVTCQPDPSSDHLQHKGCAKRAVWQSVAFSPGIPGSRRPSRAHPV